MSLHESLEKYLILNVFLYIDIYTKYWITSIRKYCTVKHPCVNLTYSPYSVNVNTDAYTCLTATLL